MEKGSLKNSLHVKLVELGLNEKNGGDYSPNSAPAILHFSFDGSVDLPVIRSEVTKAYKYSDHSNTINIMELLPIVSKNIRIDALIILLVLLFLNNCTVSTPCPLRISAGAGDPECEDPVVPIPLILVREDSLTLIKMLSVMRLPSNDLKRYVYSDSSHRIVTLGFALTGIDTLPEEIGNLKALTGLVLNNNKIRHLPKSIGDLTNLTGIRIDNNDLMDIPIEMTKLEKIGFFSYIGNPFCNVDQSKIDWMVNKSGEPFSRGANCP